MPKRQAPDKKQYNLYKLEYNWFGDLGTEYRHATSHSRAWEYLCRAVAGKYKVSTHRVKAQLNQGNRAKITIMKKGDTGE